MAAEFVIEESFGHPLCTANCQELATPEVWQLYDWMKKGGVLVTRSGQPTDHIIPAPISGLRTNRAGELIRDDTPRIRATRCVPKALFDLVYIPTIATDEFGATFRGHAASRPKRYNRAPHEPPPTFEAFASSQLIEVLDGNEGPATFIYWLADRNPNDPSKGFEPVVGGLALYSLVETEVLGVTSMPPLDNLGLGFYLNATDPITDSQISGYYRENGIRISELASR